MKKYIFLFLFHVLYISSIIAQTSSSLNELDKTIVLTVSGQGETIEKVRLKAFRNAIEQAFGTFISTNTVVLNDQLVRDEIISFSNGNIVKYEVLDEKVVSSGYCYGTYKVVVSINKLRSFCEAKGIKVEFEGGMFALNIKMQMLAEKSEVDLIWNTLFFLNPIVNKSFDYTLKVFDPISIEGNKEFMVRLLVDCYKNKNLEFVFDYLNNVLKAVSLNEEEQKSYLNLNKPLFPIRLNDNIYFLRNSESFSAIEKFFDEIILIQRRFRILDGVKNQLVTYSNFGFNIQENKNLIVNEVRNWIFESSDSEGSNLDQLSGFEGLAFNYTKSWAPSYFDTVLGNQNFIGRSFRLRSFGDRLKTFDLSLRYTLGDLEKIKSFDIQHNSKISRLSEWHNGGVIFYEDSSQYLIHPIAFQSFTFESTQYCYECESGENECPTIRLCPFDNYVIESDLKISYSKLITDTLIGSGKLNTKKLFDATTKKYISPFSYVMGLNINKYSDWYIPSLLEAYKLSEYIRKYISVTVTSNMVTSNLMRGNNYDINWDSFQEIKDLDFYDQRKSVYEHPVEKGYERLFWGNKKVFFPIRIEKK